MLHCGAASDVLGQSVSGIDSRFRALADAVRSQGMRFAKNWVRKVDRGSIILFKVFFYCKFSGNKKAVDLASSVGRPVGEIRQSRMSSKRNAGRNYELFDLTCDL